ncbi:MAG: CHAD domain-containing protein [Desulfocapsa sp.]|nr:CHAD domain-containing protein [Desulfocapsa sp.]MBN4048650.1 CHAD domain-containing protein [bacterium AH-315-N22]MBN4064070.1 CHAD domain-containing protein [bacterium AH-315-I07]
MQSLQHLSWIFPEDFVLSDLEKLLSVHFTMQFDSVKKSSRIWYDTFDWRLFRKKQRLTSEGNNWILDDFQGRQLAVLKSPEKSFRFAWQFPVSPLRQFLENSLDVRAVLPIAAEELESSSVQIFNKDKKIVVFLNIQQSTNSQNGKQRITVHMEEVRGCNKWFKRVARVLDTAAVKLGSIGDLFPFILEGTDRKPLDYGSGYAVPLTPEMSSVDATQRIFVFLLSCIRRNEEGIIDDLDSEFLHDLRVAVRRTRSALSLLKGVLTADVTDRFKEDFRYIGQITNPVRDLDIYLLNEKKYQESVPQRLQQGLTYFFETLADRRKEEQRELITSLRSMRYQQILTDWSQLLDQEDMLPAGKKGAIPIGTLAGKIIHKRFRRILNDGAKIHQRSPDSELHKLRLQCKKLRYCLEFFATLYEPQHMKQFIKQLKILQNNLGDFNDLSVQQEILADYLSKTKPGSRKSLELAASIGGLMTALAVQHHRVRAHFEKTFAHFCRPKNMKLYRQIFD